MLKRILGIIAQETGLNPNDSRQRSHMVEHVNLAAKRLHESTDLEGSMDTKDFNLAVGSALVTFPPYIGDVRKLRYVQSGEKVILGGPAARFNESGFNDAHFLRIVMQTKQALGRDIDIEGRLTFTIPLAQTNDVLFTIVGKNTNSAQATEVVTIKAGSLSATSALTYSEVTRLLREGIITVDCLITDLNSVVLAVFPNNVINLEHTMVRVAEYVTSFEADVTSRAVEAYYKKALTHMEKDYDTFVCGDLYDEALAWEYIKSFGPSDKHQQAMAAESKILADIGRDKNKGQENKIDASQNKYLKIQRSMRRYNRRSF